LKTSIDVKSNIEQLNICFVEQKDEDDMFKTTIDMM